MSNLVAKSYNKPLILSIQNIVTEANEAFVNLLGYSEGELIGRSLTEISKLIRIDMQINLQDIKFESKYFIFNRILDSIEVSITIDFLDNQNDKIIYFAEQPHKDCNQMLDFAKKIFTDRMTGVSCRISPSLVLVKADQNFITMLEEPFNTRGNCIGKNNELIYGGIEAYNTILKTGEPYYCEEIEYNHKDKGVIYYNSSIVPIFIQGELRYLVQAILDVTDKVLARRDIEQKNKELEAIFENMSDELLIFDKNGNYTRMNKAARDNPLYDFTETKGFRKSFEQANYFDVEGNSIAFDNLPFQRVIRGEKLSGYRFSKENNNGVAYKEINGTPIYDIDGSVTTGVLVCRDITDRLKNEENLLLKTQYDLLSSIIKDLDLGFVRVSYPELNITGFNRKANIELKQMNQKSESSSTIMGMNILDVNIVSKGDHTYEALWNSLQNKEQSISYIRKFKMFDADKYFRALIQPLYGLNNEIIEIIIIGIDITNEVIAKNKMEETLEKQDELFVNLSHELKTPLNVIFSASQLMDIYIDNNSLEAFKDIIQSNNKIIKQNCYRLIKLICNIVDYSKIESGYLKLNLSNQNIVEIIENVIDSVSAYVKKRDLSIIFDTDIEEEIIAIDIEKMERVILNIISNAIKFSDSGGEICINITDKIDFIQISIKDNGIGIEEKYLDSMFKRFQQIDKSLNRNTEGSGLGLSMVKSIIDMHGGKISVKSEVGKGSIFTIELPKKLLNSSKKIIEERAESRIIKMMNIEFSDIY